MFDANYSIFLVNLKSLDCNLNTLSCVKNITLLLFCLSYIEHYMEINLIRDISKRNLERRVSTSLKTKCVYEIGK